MGLAPYGEPKHTQTILDNLIDVKPDGSFRMDQSYFNYCTGLTMTNRRFDVLFEARHESLKTNLSKNTWIWRLPFRR